MEHSSNSSYKGLSAQQEANTRSLHVDDFHTLPNSLWMWNFVVIQHFIKLVLVLKQC
jgi:hypothetical protein